MRAHFAWLRIGAVLALIAALVAGGAGALQWSTLTTDTPAANEAELWADTGMADASPDEIALARADADRAQADLATHRWLAGGFFGVAIVLTALGVGTWVVAGRRRRREMRATA
jgi:hypothetical protein